MVSSYTTNKNLEKPGNGDYVDTWNIPVNDDMNIIDAALGGTTSLNATSGSANLTASQYQKMALNITGAISANVTYTIPNTVGGLWIVRNATTDASGGPWTVRIASGGGGSNVAVIRGISAMVWSDGTNIRDVTENIPSVGTVTSVAVSGGTTGLTTSGGPITTNGTITINGTLAITNGGTGITSFGTGVQAALGNTVTGTGGIVLSTGPTIANATINNAILSSPAMTTILNTGTLTLPNTTTTLIGANTTNTLTNKRITPRVSSAATTVSPFAWNSDTYDQFVFTALDTNLTINADSGTPTDGQKVIFVISDNGSARTLTWTTGSAKSFRAISFDLPTTTVANKILYVGFIYNSNANRWDCIASAQQV